MLKLSFNVSDVPEGPHVELSSERVLALGIRRSGGSVGTALSSLLSAGILFSTISGAAAVTAITDSNFGTAVSTCLGTNPVDGLCSSSEYGSMPGWDTSAVTSMD